MSAPGKASTIKSVEVRLKLRSSVRLTPVCCGVTSSSARFEAASPYLIGERFGTSSFSQLRYSHNAAAISRNAMASMAGGTM